MQDLTKEDHLKKVHDLETEEKIVNKLNRDKKSFHVSKDSGRFCRKYHRKNTNHIAWQFL